ncbi:hypothetical protein T02_7528 [Trichinella nativa]|uniref:Uncharacterized protein n=1 Tax=Trichinella nativa TaxID=6335 RepID=A0A0V1LC64_9BILA|nr:hypothetical protein T02_7528 [Trichinella nativa]
MPEIRLQKLLGVHGTGQTEESRIQVMAAQTNARQWNDQYSSVKQATTTRLAFVENQGDPVCFGNKVLKSI